MHHPYDWYYMDVARTIRSRAKCCKRMVGAIIVRDDHIVATGFNGTPARMRNCTDGGCPRCANSGQFPDGRDYDLCLCIHAEANCIIMAAKIGTSVQGGTLYTTLQPCFGCLKELYQAGVRAIIYEHPWEPPTQMAATYQMMLNQFETVIHYRERAH